MKIFLIYFSAGIFLLTVVFPSSLFAADTVYFQVRYLDFHHDSSSPEFYNPCPVTPGGGTVDDRVESTGLPIAGGVNPQMTAEVRKWYNDFTPDPQKIVYKYTLNTNGGDTCYSEPGMQTDIDYDTAYKDTAVYDSLAFKSLGNGNYEFVNDSFFPLDGQGFGNEGENHNYAFTMRFNLYFPKTYGSSITINSSDDSWVFLNWTRFIDLGGAHPRLNHDTTVTIDTSNYPGASIMSLFVFFANRGSASSFFKIKFNNIPLQPSDGVIDYKAAQKNAFWSSNAKILTNPQGIEIVTSDVAVSSVTILKPNGQMVYKTSSCKGRIHAPISRQGIYLVNIVTDKGIVTKPVAILKR